MSDASDRAGAVVQPHGHPARRRAAGRVPRPRTGRSARRGCCGRSGRRRSTSARCAPGSTSTPATSAGCCARSRPTGLVAVEPDASRPARADGRASPPPAARERAVLDRRSDALAESLLAPLGDAQRERLVDGDGGRRAAPDRRASSRSRSRTRAAPAAPVLPRRLRRRARRDASRRGFDTGAQPRRSTRPRSRRRRGLLLVARLHGEPVALRRAEAPARRAGGDQAHVGRAGARAASASAGACSRSSRRTRGRPGREVVRLDTNRALRAATRCTARRATSRCAPFNDEPYAHHWFEKRLAPG